MNILHVIPGMANASGPSHVAANLADQFSRRGNNVTIYHVTGRGADCGVPVSSSVEVRGFPGVGLKKWAYSPTLQDHLFRNVRRFDLVHLHSMWLFPNIAVSRAARRHDVPYIIRPAGSLEPWCFHRSAFRKRLYLALIERRVLNRSAAIHAVSRKEADNLQTYGFSAPSFVVPNGIDASHGCGYPDKHASRRSLGIPVDRRVILFLSRIHEVKGLDILGEAFVRVQRGVSDAFLVVAGPDQHSYAAKIKRLYERLGIGTDCMFLGEVSGSQKWRAYQAADVFVLPSHSENFGVVIPEAMSAGVPVVVSVNTPWAVAQKAGAGFWVDNHSDAVAMRLVQILANRSLRADMSRRARSLVESQFSWSAIADSLEQVYADILAGRCPQQPVHEPFVG